jgi:hypothetical protein
MVDGAVLVGHCKGCGGPVYTAEIHGCEAVLCGHNWSGCDGDLDDYMPIEAQAAGAVQS